MCECIYSDFIIIIIIITARAMECIGIMVTALPYEEFGAHLQHLVNTALHGLAAIAQLTESGKIGMCVCIGVCA